MHEIANLYVKDILIESLESRMSLVYPVNTVCALCNNTIVVSASERETEIKSILTQITAKVRILYIIY